MRSLSFFLFRTKFQWLDVLGNSHQIFHLCAVITIYSGYHACLADCIAVANSPALSAVVTEEWEAATALFTSALSFA